MIKHLAYLVWGVVLGSTVQAQSLPELANTFNEFMLCQGNKHLKAAVWVRDTNNGPNEELGGYMHLWQSGQSYHYQFMDIEVVQDENYLIKLDHTEKSLQVFKPVDPTSLSTQYSISAINEFLTYADAVNPLNSKPDCFGYNLYFGEMDDGLQSIDLYYSKKDTFLHEMQYHYKFYDWVTQSRSRYDVRIVYEQYQFPPSIAKEEFDTSVFIKAKGQTISAGIEYSDYSIWIDPNLPLKLLK